MGDWWVARRVGHGLISGGVDARRRAAASVDVAGAGRRSGSGGPSQERWSGGPTQRRHGSYRAQPCFTTVGAPVDISPEHAREEGLDGFEFGRRWSRYIEGGPTGVQMLGAVAIGEEARVPGSASSAWGARGAETDG